MPDIHYIQHPFHRDVYVPVEEDWKDIPGFEGLYQISSFGEVKSLPRISEFRNSKRPVHGRMLKKTVYEHGHVAVSLWKHGKGKMYLVHRLVLLTFVGPSPEGLMCCHANDIPHDNRVVNLRWDTAKANQRDRFEKLRVTRGPITLPVPKPIHQIEVSQIPSPKPVEVWKDVPGYIGKYQVSNFGHVKSLARQLPSRTGGFKKEQILKLNNHTAGYAWVTLRGEIHEAVLVHRLVLRVFIGPCPPNMVACHNDGNPSNNCLWNLRWDTENANAADRKRHGTCLIGENAVGAKLTEEEVRRIREFYATGRYFQRELARMFGVRQGVISAIVRYRYWRHVA